MHERSTIFPLTCLLSHHPTPPPFLPSSLFSPSLPSPPPFLPLLPSPQIDYFISRVQLNFLQLLSSNAIQRVQLLHHSNTSTEVNMTTLFRGVSGKVLGGSREELRPAVIHNSCEVSQPVAHWSHSRVFSVRAYITFPPGGQTRSHVYCL